MIIPHWPADLLELREETRELRRELRSDIREMEIDNLRLPAHQTNVERRNIQHRVTLGKRVSFM